MTCRQRLRRLLPPLFYDHPGYFRVACGVLLCHVALLASTLDPQRIHNTPAWGSMVQFLHDQLWVSSALHLLCLVLIVAGMYWKGHFYVSRWGFALSAVLFNLLVVSFTIAAITKDISYYASVVTFAMSVSSLAAAREPAVNPLHMRGRR